MRLIENSKKSNVKAKVALVITVGTSIEPLEASVHKEAEESSLSLVIAFYGAALPRQVVSPLEVVNQLKKVVYSYGCEFVAREIPDPNNIDSCLESIRLLLRDQQFDDYDEVIFNITGGSKPLSAALAIAATRLEVSSNICISYVGGTKRDEVGRVVSEGMQHIRSLNTITREKEEDIFINLKRNDFLRAMVIAEQLPDKGKLHFLRRSCKVLHLWDSFQYEQSLEEISRLTENAAILSGEPNTSYSSLAFSIIQLEPLLKEMNKIISFVKDFSNTNQARRDADAFMKDRMRQLKQNEQLQNYYIRLIADCLENARRHIGRAPVETVMRAYRAIELAVKLSLLINEINPDKPQWDDIDPGILAQAGISEKPAFIMLDMGIKILKAIGLNLSQGFEKAKAEVTHTRNRCYLEHGFDEIPKRKAEKVLEQAKNAVSELIDKHKLDQMCQDISMVLITD
ncbi:MAG: hypothetical protein K6T94_26470 [Paenibacillus sp.]|nr:hypothetical protein [Paenibacillus sp.]